MCETDWSHISEQDLDVLLEQSVPPPPDQIVRQVTPWRRAMNRVLVGSVLCTLTLQFWNLQYLLPAIGTVLLLLGFRTLRQENRSFRLCFGASALRCACCIGSLTLNATVWRGAASAWLAAASTALMLAALVGLWQGLRAVRRKAGLLPGAAGAAALTVWYAVLVALGAAHVQGPLLPLLMLAAYGVMLRSVWRLTKELDEAGYAVQAAPVRLSDGHTAAALAISLAVCLACGYLFAGKYQMHWQETAPAQQGGTAEERALLLSLGFPETVLNDLSPEDLAACKGALRVTVHTEDMPINDGRVVRKTSGSGAQRFTTETTVYDRKELRLTSVAVELPEGGAWRVFHHFQWVEGPGFCGTESIQLWPTYQGIPDGWTQSGGLTGRVLYDRDGKTFAAPYASLGPETFSSANAFGATQTSTDIFAAFSMPAKGERQRGYVAYSARETQEGYLLSSWINYTHQVSPLQYPVVTAMEKRMATVWHRAGVFRTVQDALQFYPSEGPAEETN